MTKALKLSAIAAACLFASQANAATNASVTALGTLLAAPYNNTILFNAHNITSSLVYGNGGASPATTATWSPVALNVWASPKGGDPSDQGDSTVFNYVKTITGLDLTSANRIGKCDFGSSCDSGLSQNAQDGTSNSNAYTFDSTKEFSVLALHYGGGELVFQFASPTKAFSILGLKNGVSNTTAFSLPSPTPPVPIPAAVWMVGSALAGVAGFSRRKKKQDA